MSNATEEYPDLIADSPRGRLHVTKDAARYRAWVREGKIAFTWNEMNRILDCNPSLTSEDKDWAMRVKKTRPGTRIDNIKERAVTSPPQR